MFRATLVTLLLAVAAWPALGQEHQPRMVMPEILHNLGDIFEQDAYEHRFVVRNTGGADLRIEDVKPGCGCTVAQFDTLIAPGQEGAITLTIAGDKVHGSFSKAATVRSNDPNRPVMTITLAGNEIPFVKVVPSERVYLQGTYGEDVEQTLTVSSNEKGFALEITGIESDLEDKVTFAYEKGATPGQWAVTLRKNPELPTQSTYGTVTIHTNSPNAPDKILQVQVIAKGTITVEPSFVNFGRVHFGEDGNNGDVLEKSVTLIRSTGEFTIDETTINNDHFQAEVVEEVPGKRYRVGVKFTAPARTRGAQIESGELVIHTNDPHEPSVRVQLIARAL